MRWRIGIRLINEFAPRVPANSGLQSCNLASCLHHNQRPYIVGAPNKCGFSIYTVQQNIALPPFFPFGTLSRRDHIMGEFTIQISNNLVNRLIDDVEVSKKKTRRTKRKVPREPEKPQPNVSQKQILDGSGKPESAATPGWLMHPPLFLPATSPVQSVHSELHAIRSVLQESETVVERLQEQEENKLQEVTRKAKELRDKEYKLPNPKPEPCMAERVASLACYKEHVKDPLECASLVTSFADCIRRFGRLGHKLY